MKTNPTEAEAEAESVEAVLQKALALVSYPATGADDEAECAKCHGAVSVKDGYEWDDGDICYDCATAVVQQVKELLSEHVTAAGAPPVTPNPASPSTAAGEREEGPSKAGKLAAFLAATALLSVPPVNVEPEDLGGKEP